MSIKILVADNCNLCRKGLVYLLSKIENIEVVAEAVSDKEVIDKAKTFYPHIVIMNACMPALNGPGITAILAEELPQVKVIALSMNTNAKYVREMMEAGVDGYLSSNCDFEDLIIAIETVFAGNKYFDKQVTDLIIMGYLGDNKQIVSVLKELTERELEIFRLLADGYQVREIAEKLFISVKTVGTHRQNIMRKLQLKSMADLVKYALKKGITSLD